MLDVTRQVSGWLRPEYERILRRIRAADVVYARASVEPSEAKRMIGSKVGWPVDDPKICGKIVGVHGRTGTLRVRFNRGVPGQALGSRVRIFE